ncbi:MAG: hypothetical protein IT538_10185, partial [Variibacter sp.]|nr:hypothetical protein [Variibacter sp.]
VASALFPSETVADYAVASRLAALFSFLTLVLLKQFSPRAGYLMETDDRAALRREVELCRHLVIGFTALTVGGLLLAAPLLLPVFGNYGGALVFLAWLAIPSFIQSFYATSDRLLIIGGHANVALALTASSFLVLVTSPFATARWLGLAAVPAAMIFSALAFNPLVAAKARQWLRIATIRWRDAAAMLGGSAALAAAALDGSASSRVLACALMGALGAAYLIAGARPALGSAEAAS